MRGALDLETTPSIGYTSRTPLAIGYTRRRYQSKQEFLEHEKSYSMLQKR
jgi:hypothetical protein